MVAKESVVFVVAVEVATAADVEKESHFHNTCGSNSEVNRWHKSPKPLAMLRWVASESFEETFVVAVAAVVAAFVEREWHGAFAYR